MLSLMLAASLLFPSPSTLGKGVHPSAWARSALELFEAPAGLSRLEYGQVHGWVWSEGTEGFRGSVSGGLPVSEGVFALGASVAGRTDLDSYAVAAGGSWVITGDPIGFMEGLFGPSIVLGASGGLQDTGEGAGPFATASAQFSMFPSFALGAASHWRDSKRASVSFGFTHVFNRAFTLNASISRGDPEIGAVLRVSPGLGVSAGTNGKAWHSGVSVERGPFVLDLAVVLTEDTVSGGAGVTWRPAW